MAIIKNKSMGHNKNSKPIADHSWPPAGFPKSEVEQFGFVFGGEEIKKVIAAAEIEEKMGTTKTFHELVAKLTNMLLADVAKTHNLAHTQVYIKKI